MVRPERQLYGMGLHRLMGTVRYAPQASARQSSLSRVPENGMHGLKGVLWRRAAFKRDFAMTYQMFRVLGSGSASRRKRKNFS
jgi:hypothetical protein